MNQNWKRQMLIFAGLCIGVGFVGMGMQALFNVHIHIPMLVPFVIECAIASLIEHRLEVKEQLAQ